MADNDKNNGDSEVPENPEDLFDDQKGPKEDDVHNKGKGDGVPNSDGGGEDGSDGGSDPSGDDGGKSIEWASPEDELIALRMLVGMQYYQIKSLTSANTRLLLYLNQSSDGFQSFGKQQESVLKCFVAIEQDLHHFADNQSNLQAEGIKLAEAHADLIGRYLSLAGDFIEMASLSEAMSGAMRNFKIKAGILAACALFTGFACGLLIHKIPALIDVVSFWLR